MLIDDVIKEHINKLQDLIYEYEELNSEHENLFNTLVYKESLKLAKRAKPIHRFFMYRWVNRVLHTSKFIVISLTSPIWIIPAILYLKLEENR